MIIGIGCDIVEHRITEDLGWLSDNNTLRRIFSEKELELNKANKTNRFISGRFAAKEAVLKCLGTGMKDGISLADIEVLQTENGKPFILTKGEVGKIIIQLGIDQFHLSISHTSYCSIAFVIAESKDHNIKIMID
jgi:holo-[acyl-carrier protein] synthase